MHGTENALEQLATRQMKSLKNHSKKDKGTGNSYVQVLVTDTGMYTRVFDIRLAVSHTHVQTPRHRPADIHDYNEKCLYLPCMTRGTNHIGVCVMSSEYLLYLKKPPIAGQLC